MLVSKFHQIFVGALLFRRREHSMIKGAADIKDLSQAVARLYSGEDSIWQSGLGCILGILNHRGESLV